MGFRIRYVLAVFAVLALVAAACGGGDESGEPVRDDSTTTSSTADVGEPEVAAVTTIDEVEPAVVQIVAQGSFVDPEFGEIEGGGSGSGFIIAPEGIVVTNNHVVTGAAILEVYVEGEDEPLNAQVLGVSECSDLAVIQLEGEDYPYFDWYAGEIAAGLDIFAAGFPLGDPEFTLTRGIVAKAEADGETQWSSVDSVIEHDANTQPGNSGGPLVTEDASVVGVHYRGVTPGVTKQNYAISAEDAAPIVGVLQEGSDVDSIGVNGFALDPESGFAGIWVSSVATGSPAAEAGIQGGDIIEKLEGLTMGSDGTMHDYCNVLRTKGSDAVLSVQVLRFESNEVLQGEINGDELEVRAPIFEAAEDAGVTESVTGGGGTAGTGTYSDYAQVFDDTGTIVMDLPVEWTDILGTPLIFEDGTEVGPQLIGSPNIDAYFETFDVPGVEFVATLDPTLSTGEWLDLIGPSELCVSDGREPYDDGFFVGELEFWVDCGGSGAVIVTLAATQNANPDWTALLFGQIVTEADFEAMDRVLSTFDIVG